MGIFPTHCVCFSLRLPRTPFSPCCPRNRGLVTHRRRTPPSALTRDRGPALGPQRGAHLWPPLCCRLNRFFVRRWWGVNCSTQATENGYIIWAGVYWASFVPSFFLLTKNAMAAVGLLPPKFRKCRWAQATGICQLNSYCRGLKLSCAQGRWCPGSYMPLPTPSLSAQFAPSWYLQILIPSIQTTHLGLHARERINNKKSSWDSFGASREMGAVAVKKKTVKTVTTPKC